MTSRSYFGKMNSILGSVVPLAMFHSIGSHVNANWWIFFIKFEEFFISVDISGGILALASTRDFLQGSFHFRHPMYCEYIVSSVRSSNSHPNLLLIHHHPPTTQLFQITPVLVLDNNIGLSLSESLQLYQRQSLDSPAGYMYTL